MVTRSLRYGRNDCYPDGRRRYWREGVLLPIRNWVIETIARMVQVGRGDGGSSKETLAGWNKLVPSLGMVPSFFGNDFFFWKRDLPFLLEKLLLAMQHFQVRGKKGGVN